VPDPGHAELVRRWFDELFTAGDVDAVDDLVAEGFLAHGPGDSGDSQGREAFKDWLRWHTKTFTERDWRVDEVLSEDDRAAVRYTGHSTYRGGLLGITSAGQRVLETGMLILRIVDGCVHELWAEMSDAQVLTQLGAVHPGDPGGETPRFSKWHALGNAYLVVERAELAHPLDETLARRLCDPATGIGADGVLEVTGAEGNWVAVQVWNPDGSTAEVSGNGARIAARWLADRAGTGNLQVRMGGRQLRAAVTGDEVELELGPVDVGPDETLDVAGEAVVVAPVDAGNPHAVVLTEPTADALRRLGAELERHPRFPERTNVQLVRVDGPHELTVRVWERGAGETPASGSSAVAAAAVAVARAWCRSPVTVRLPGGNLTVALQHGNATLSGPAVEVCRGRLAL
jgi:diaminopimelate epimerase